MNAMPGIDGLVTLTELAALKGISKQAVSKRLKKFEAAGLVKPERHGVAIKVRLAEWDHAAKDTTHPSRFAVEDEEPARTAPAAASTGYSAEQARRARYDADLKEIELRERRGELVQVRDVEQAMVACAEELARAIDQLPARADDIVAALQKGGAAGVRDVLKGIAREQRAALAESMRLKAGEGD